MGGVVELFAVAREEDCAGAGTVADADDVALVVGGRICCAIEGLVVAAVAGRGVRDRVLMPACIMQPLHTLVPKSLNASPNSTKPE